MISSKQVERPRPLLVLPVWDLAVILETLANPSEPLQEASLKHLTYKTVFLLAMTSAGRRSELQDLLSDSRYLWFTLRALALHSTLALSLGASLRDLP